MNYREYPEQCRSKEEISAGNLSKLYVVGSIHVARFRFANDEINRPRQ
jgi:hypothetical protein